MNLSRTYLGSKHLIIQYVPRAACPHVLEKPPQSNAYCLVDLPGSDSFSDVDMAKSQLSNGSAGNITLPLYCSILLSHD